MIKLLLQLGTSVNGKVKFDEYNEYTAIHAAARNGCQNVIHSLTNGGASVNSSCYTNVDKCITPLHLASQNGHVKCVEALINAKCDLNEKTKSGYTALMFAAERGHVNCLQALIERGANMNDSTRGGFTALMKAVREGHITCVKALIRSRADANISTKNDYTALMIAARNKSLDCVKELIQAQADVNKVNKSGSTALVEAVKIDCANLSEAALRNHFHCMLQQLHKMEDVHFVTQNPMNDLVELVRLLVNAGADVNKKGNHCSTALIYAAKNGSTNIIRLLVEAGACVNDVSVDGSTPLMYAAENENVTAVLFLLCAEACVQIKDSSGLSAFDRLKKRRGGTASFQQMELILFAAGEVDVSSSDTWKKPGDSSSPLPLSMICRENLRRHFLTLNRHKNLYSRVLQLPLPSQVQNFLLFDTLRSSMTS